jgi:hypothetical protein
MNNLCIIQYCSRSRKSELSSDWHTKGFGRTSDRHCGIRQPMERRTGGGRVDESAAGGDLKTSGKKVTLKGRVKPFASTFLTLSEIFGEVSRVNWDELRRRESHVVHLCDVTWLGWWLLTFAFNTGELQYTETILCILTYKIVERLTIIIRPPYTLWSSSRSGPKTHIFLPSARPNLEG